jgi:hypothetical protein
MTIDVPEEVSKQMEEGERIVGYMKTLYKEVLVFTKAGCGTKDGCRNYLYRSEEGYKKEKAALLRSSDLEKHERGFVSAFLWDR